MAGPSSLFSLDLLPKGGQIKGIHICINPILSCSRCGALILFMKPILVFRKSISHIIYFRSYFLKRLSYSLLSLQRLDFTVIAMYELLLSIVGVLAHSMNIDSPGCPVKSPLEPYSPYDVVFTSLTSTPASPMRLSANVFIC